VAYDPQQWHDLYLMLGTAAAALTGLVFVALSLHLRAIGADRFQRARGHYLTFRLIYLTVVAAFVLIPGQGDDALGIELLVGGIVGAVVTGVPLARMRSNLPLTLGFRTRVVAASVAVALKSHSRCQPDSPSRWWALLPHSRATARYGHKRFRSMGASRRSDGRRGRTLVPNREPALQSAESPLGDSRSCWNAQTPRS